MNTLMASGGKVAAVVVTFQPDLERLSALIDATLPQVGHVFIVDNGDGTALQALVPRLSNTNLIVLGENRGIGAAQNVGAKAAMDAGYDFLLLLDQDSIPAAQMVARLQRAYEELKAHGHLMGAVGPRTPSREDPGSFVTFGWFRYRKALPQGAEPWIFCDLLIASGCLIPAAVFRDVGPMSEALFIDKVDTEWCIRAAARGYRLAGVPDTVLNHSLGEHTLTVWWRGWKHIASHRPFRYYYIFRNGILVARMPHVGWRWRTADFKQSIQIMIFFGIISPQRRQNLPMMFRGIWAGLCGQSGPMANPMPAPAALNSK